MLGDRAPSDPVWHCAVRAAPGDPDLGDGAWMQMAAEIMHRTGLSRRGGEDEAVPWVAVHHGGNHIHIVAAAGPPRQPPGRSRRTSTTGSARRCATSRPSTAWRRWPGPTGPRPWWPGRAETLRPRPGPGRPSRPGSRCAATSQAAAAAARSESAEFFAALARREVQVRLRHSDRDPAEVSGYAVGLPDHLTAAGQQVWFSGGKLAPDLTLPKLRRRWPDPGPRISSPPGLRPAAGPAATGTACQTGWPGPRCAARLAGARRRPGRRRSSSPPWMRPGC